MNAAPDSTSPLRGEAAEPVMAGHTYDGIREYDNPMPGWWVWSFWACVVFAPLYMLGVHTFGWIDTYGDDFAERGAQLEAARTDYAANGPSFKTDAGALAEYAADPARATAGAAVFATTCASCHGPEGGGLIGPNLTDDFWLHGAGPEAVWVSINEGWVDSGMPAWKDMLPDEDRADLLAFVASIQGSNPAAAKPPQGDPGSF